MTTSPLFSFLSLAVFALELPLCISQSPTNTHTEIPGPNNVRTDGRGGVVMLLGMTDERGEKVRSIRLAGGKKLFSGPRYTSIRFFHFVFLV